MKAITRKSIRKNNINILMIVQEQILKFIFWIIMETLFIKGQLKKERINVFNFTFCNNTVLVLVTCGKFPSFEGKTKLCCKKNGNFSDFVRIY